MKMRDKKYVIMCVGRTHTGKTTFAKKLVKKHTNFLNIDSDEIAVFLKERYLLVVDSAYNKHRPNFKNLKAVLFQDIYRFCLNTGVNIILSNGNIARDMRLLIAREAKKQGYSLVTIYFNLPEELILQRLKKSKKSTKVFIQSKNWLEVFERQKKYVQFPPSKKNTIYFEINKNADYRVVMKEIDTLM